MNDSFSRANDVSHQRRKLDETNDQAGFFDASLLAQFSLVLCKGCPALSPGGFCSARIHSNCLRINNAGGVQVSLSAGPQVWFETIAQLGNVLHLTRNPAGILARLGKMPLPGESYRPNLAEYASLWAVYETTPQGMRYGLAVRDVSGMEFERILLTPDADHERFKQFVFAHQSPPEKHTGWLPANLESSRKRRQTLVERIPRLRTQWSAGDRVVRRRPVRFVPKLLGMAAAKKIQIRTTSYHPGLASSVDWTPLNHAETTRASANLDFFHGHNGGLH